MSGAFAKMPPTERPRTPDVAYGVPIDGGSMIGWAECVERLRMAEAYWLATTGPDRAPHVVPVWGVLVDDDLYLETGAAEHEEGAQPRRQSGRGHSSGRHQRRLDRPRHRRRMQARCLILETPWRQPSMPSTRATSRARADWDEGGLHRIEPRVMLAWRDMPTATRWRFPTRAVERV